MFASLFCSNHTSYLARSAFYVWSGCFCLFVLHKLHPSLALTPASGGLQVHDHRHWADCLGSFIPSVCHSSLGPVTPLSWWEAVFSASDLRKELGHPTIMWLGTATMLEGNKPTPLSFAALWAPSCLFSLGWCQSLAPTSMHFTDSNNRTIDTWEERTPLLSWVLTCNNSNDNESNNLEWTW